MIFLNHVDRRSLPILVRLFHSTPVQSSNCKRIASSLTWSCDEQSDHQTIYFRLLLLFNAPFFFSFSGATVQLGLRPPHCCSFYITRRHMHSRIPPNESSARRRGPCLHNKHNRRTPVPSSRFEPAISGIEWPQTCALDRTSTRIGRFTFLCSVTIICTIALIFLPWRKSL